MRLNNSRNIFMKMTDDNKEYIFNEITRWLRESNFVIIEEKITVVTSEFYAKAYLQSSSEHAFEVRSSTSGDSQFEIRVKLQVSEQQLAIYEKFQTKEKLKLDDEMNAAISLQHHFINILNKSAFLEKTISIDPKAIDAKQELIQNVSNLLESANKLEIRFNELHSDQRD
jgi:hypothetical protein